MADSSIILKIIVNNQNHFAYLKYFSKIVLLIQFQFVSYDNIDIIKSNLKSWVEKFKQDSSDWLQEELGNALFLDTKFAEIPDFTLDMSADKPFLTEAENVKRIYSNLNFLSDSQASDERLWVGLCLGPFWSYVKYRWDIDKKCTVGNVQQHFFFGFGARRSLTRNALSRLWSYPGPLL